MTPDSLIGTLFAGRFQIERMLGEGGFGRVYLAHHLVLRRHFALKVLGEQFEADPTMEARFRREARAASRIAHPSVAQVFDFGRTSDGLSYIAMEYAEGPTLAQALAQQGALALPRAMQILTQVAEGLAAAHQRQVVHRDIKPSNVLLAEEDGSERAKILDFGLAKALDSQSWSDGALSATGMVSGTPLYLAPEMLDGRTPDLSADIYAFGVLAFEVLSGRPPFRGTLQQILGGHCTGTPPRLSTLRALPPELEELVLWCMEKEPGNRPRAGELVASLRSIVLVQDQAAADASGAMERLLAQLAQHGIETAPLTESLAALHTARAGVRRLDTEIAVRKEQRRSLQQQIAEQQNRLTKHLRELRDSAGPLPPELQQLLRRAGENS